MIESILIFIFILIFVGATWLFGGFKGNTPPSCHDTVIEPTKTDKPCKFLDCRWHSTSDPTKCNANGWFYGIHSGRD